MKPNTHLNAGIFAAALTGCLATSSFAAITVTPSSDPSALAANILGSGVTLLGAPSFDGTATSAGTFTNGLDAGIGIDSGIVLTTGDATFITGTNTLDDIGVNNGLGGDAGLDALTPGTTQDATRLTFEFQIGDGSTGGDLFFNYVFASEEYNEFVDSDFNDVFGFFLDGTNVALLDDGITPVAINNVNGTTNSSLFNNNDLDDGGPFFDFEYDGFTNVLSVEALGLAPGSHTIELVIADTADGVLDSGVFIQAGTFDDNPTPPSNNVPDEGSTLILLGLALVLGGGSRLAARRRLKKG